MNKSFKILKYTFHTLNFIMIVLYLYPGSILGWIVYGDLKFQPQITRDLLYISSNHFYAFFLLSVLGLFCYLWLKLIVAINKQTQNTTRI